jgi:hypothetical protein
MADAITITKTDGGNRLAARRDQGDTRTPCTVPLSSAVGPVSARPLTGQVPKCVADWLEKMQPRLGNGYFRRHKNRTCTGLH